MDKSDIVERRDFFEIEIKSRMYKLLLIVVNTFSIYACQTSTAEKSVDSADKISQTGTDETASKIVERDTSTPKVTGIGGIFFKTKNPADMKKWYGDNLGLAIGPHGSPFAFRNAHNPSEINYLNWDALDENTDYFNPSTKAFMINYRVQNIQGLVENLKKTGVTIVDT